jgi:beta-lactam-binding protein with PASTA domain/predicted Ser/Thr protein kinase
VSGNTPYTPPGSAGARLLGERYELGELLGRGGMADVRRGYDTRLGRTVAIKTLRSDLATDPSLHARFRREAQNAAGLNHPSIVSVYDTGEDELDGEEIPYIVMEFVPGRTLRDVVREGRAMLPERALEITADVLGALAYSHRAGIIHRDIKPGNVMITPGGDVKVMDFGIARAISDSSSTMTQTAAVMGTAQYLSPEQARGEKVDARSDLYSTGCMLYELLTGRPPFVGDSPVSVAYQHVREMPEPPSTRNPELGPEIDALVMRSLAKSRDARYQDADAFRTDVERVMAGQTVTSAAPILAPTLPAEDLAAVAAATGVIPGFAEPTGFEPPAEEPTRRKRRVAGWVVLIVAVLAVFVGAAYGLNRYFDNQANVAKATVPAVTGISQAEAENAIRQAGLVPKATSAASDTVDKGDVISQAPQAEQKVDTNTTVGIVVSTGKPQVTVPPLTGLSVDEATKKLVAIGLVAVPEVDDTADGRANEVVSSNPGSGTEVTKGSKVTLTYANGDVEVPKLTEMTQADAEALLVSLGFAKPTVVTQESSQDAGMVIGQQPAKGTRRPLDATIVIIVAIEPKSTPAPSPSPSPSATESPSPSPSETPSPSKTPSPSNTASDTASPSDTAKPPDE